MARDTRDHLQRRVPGDEGEQLVPGTPPLHPHLRPLAVHEDAVSVAGRPEHSVAPAGGNLRHGVLHPRPELVLGVSSRGVVDI